MSFSILAYLALSGPHISFNYSDEQLLLYENAQLLATIDRMSYGDRIRNLYYWADDQPGSVIQHYQPQIRRFEFYDDPFSRVSSSFQAGHPNPGALECPIINFPGCIAIYVVNLEVQPFTEWPWLFKVGGEVIAESYLTDEIPITGTLIVYNYQPICPDC